MAIVQQSLWALCAVTFLSGGFGLNLALAKDKANATPGQKQTGQTSGVARSKNVQQINPFEAVNVKKLKDNPTPADAKAAADAKNKDNKSKCGGPGQFPCKGN